MSWFQSSNFASIAKNALKEAQKTLDKALDIKEEETDEDDEESEEESGPPSVATVASVTEAATDFFASWGVDFNKTTKKKSEETVSTSDEPNLSTEVVTKAPVFTSATKNEQLLNGDFDHDHTTVLQPEIMTRSLTSDIPIELLVPSDESQSQSAISTNKSSTSSLLQLAESQSSDESKFQSLWLADSDSFESSIDTTSAAGSTTNSIVVESLDGGTTGIEVSSPTIIKHPKPIKGKQRKHNNKKKNLNRSTALIQETSKEPEKPEIQLLDQNFAEVSLDHSPEKSCPTATTDSAIDLDLESSSATIIGTEVETPVLVPESEAQGEEPTSHILNEQESNRPNFDEIDSHISSKMSASSRATSSISVISEGKESSPNSSPPQLSPPSPTTRLAVTAAAQQMILETSSSLDSQSFEVISMHHQHPGHPGTGHSHTSSISVIPSLQSTPDRGTPMTHSRSNSNTSSSFDRIEDYHNNHKHSSGGSGSNKCPSSGASHSQFHNNFMSSASSSDIEVIPLDSSSIELRRAGVHRAKIPTNEVETQTDEIAAAQPTEKIVEIEKIVEVIPPKITSSLLEKDNEILQLREEGDKLSKKILELNNAVKKLRKNEKESDLMIKTLKTDMIKKDTELERLMKSFIHKEGTEHAQNELISKLNQDKRQLTEKINKLKSQLEDEQENTASMKASLEEASIEILELQNIVLTAQKNSTELDTLTREKADLIQRSESYQKEIESLRSSLNSLQQKSSQRESELITQLHNQTTKIHSLENQLGDISSEIADATMPLSLEIEKLQQELNTRQSAWDKREYNLQSQINELEYKVQSFNNENRKIHESEKYLKSTIQKLETENEDLVEQIKELKTEMQDQDSKLNKINILEDKNEELEKEVQEMKKYVETLQNELKNERNLTEIESRKVQLLSEQLKSIASVPPIERRESSMSRGGDGSPSNTSIISEASYLDDVLEGTSSAHQLHQHHQQLTPKSFFENYSSSTNYLEHLQGQLRQRELELLQLHDEIGKNEKIRKTLNDEIANLTVNNQELLVKMDSLESLQSRLVELEKNYNAVLQMYGEKVEEADELRMDLQDVKEMYKTQIEQLLKKS